MDGVKQQIRARQIEAMDNRHHFEMKKIRRGMKDEIDKLKKKSESTVTDLKKDYDRKILQEQTQLETKLIDIRRRNKDIVKTEEEKFAKTVEEMKLTHKQKLTELEIAQDKEVERQQTEYANYLETAEQKFESEKAKIEA